MLTRITDSTACDAIDGALDNIKDRLFMLVRKSSVDYEDINRKLQWSFPGIGLVVWAISDEFGFGIHDEIVEILTELKFMMALMNII